MAIAANSRTLLLGSAGIMSRLMNMKRGAIKLGQGVGPDQGLVCLGWLEPLCSRQRAICAACRIDFDGQTKVGTGDG
jgi:hypothetical protein